MTRKDKHAARFRALEDQFRSQLARELRHSIQRQSFGVLSLARNLPEDWPPSAASKRGDELAALADELLRAGAMAGTDLSQSVASAFLDVCRRCSNLADHHRSPADLAARLLAVIESDGDTRERGGAQADAEAVDGPPGPSVSHGPCDETEASTSMTLDAVESSLPNGLHDALVHSLAVDFTTRVATLHLDIWIGDMEAPSRGGRETYRPARLELRGLAYLVSEPPDARYNYSEARPIKVDLCDADPTGPVPPLRPGDFAARFFVSAWNAFISVSARDTALEWTGSAFVRPADENPSASRKRPA
jgi:hypothetical protein